MSFAYGMLLFIGIYIALPLLIGGGILVVVGGSTALVCSIPFYFLKYVVTPLFCVINRIPYLGRLVTSVAACVLGLTAAAAIGGVLGLPLFFCLCSGLGGPMAGLVDLQTDQPLWKCFGWAFEYMELFHAWPGGLELEFPGAALKLLLMAPFIAVTSFVPLGGGLASLGWSLQMVFCPPEMNEIIRRR